MTMTSRRSSHIRARRIGVFAIGVLAATAFASLGAAAPEAVFASYEGSWAGAGRITLSNGNVESLRCKGYYTPKDHGKNLGLAVRCASASNSLDLRAALSATGDTVSGTWEERTFNAAGEVTGHAKPGRIDLAIAGGGFEGAMEVEMVGSGHRVSISTEGIALKSIDIDFSRMDEDR